MYLGPLIGSLANQRGGVEALPRPKTLLHIRGQIQAEIVYKSVFIQIYAPHKQTENALINRPRGFASKGLK